MFPAFGLSVYERDKMADYSSAWRVITRIGTDYFFYHEDISLSRIILLSHGESRMIYLSRISELSNYSSHGESRTVTQDFFVTNLRIVLHTENCGWSRRIYLSRISELANYSSHGESRTVTEDLFVTNLRIVLHTDGHGESRRISMA